MTARERFLATVRFGVPDRLPNFEYGSWPQTVRRWHGEGLPKDQSWSTRQPGCERDPREVVRLRLDMIPPFEEKILEENERTITVQRTDGCVTRALKEDTIDGIRACMDQYLDAPVHNITDFKAIQFRYQADEPERYPSDWNEQVERWRSRDWPPSLGGAGVLAHLRLYMQLRNWMGTEQLSYALYDQAPLVHEMLDFFTDFLLSLMEKALCTVKFDYFYFAEDFAYKNAPLMSPVHFREFFAPRYRKIIDRLHKAGTDIIVLDSDGNYEALIPMLLDLGINCLAPLEAAAGMDPVRLRKQYPKDLVLMGGLDKRAMAKGPEAIEQELHSKILPLLERGAYIPHLDHLFTEDISYSNLLYYLQLKKELCSLSR